MYKAAVITMMGKPDSGMARGELRSTLSRAGPCRSSATTSMKDDGDRKAESAHEDSASRKFRSMTRQEAQAKPGQERNERRGEILRHYIFQNNLLRHVAEQEKIHILAP